MDLIFHLFLSVRVQLLRKRKLKSLDPAKLKLLKFQSFNSKRQNLVSKGFQLPRSKKARIGEILEASRGKKETS